MPGPLSATQVLASSLLVERVQTGQNNQAGISGHANAEIQAKKQKARKETVVNPEESDKVGVNKDKEREKQKRRQAEGKDEEKDAREQGASRPIIKHIDVKA
jgi:hypothetical protein